MPHTALIIIDMQMEIQCRIESGMTCVNPEAPARIAELMAAFRRKGLPVLHLRHAEEDSASAFYHKAPTYQAMICGQHIENEYIFVKNTSSAFASTNLEIYLRQNEINSLVVTGAVMGFCINSTVRAGSDLGFKMTIVQDAVVGFDLPSAHLSAQAVFDVTLALLNADFAKAIDSAAMLAELV